MSDLTAASLILSRALASPYGVELLTSDPVRAKAHLYRARAESKDPALGALSIREGTDGKLWVVKGGAGA